MKNTFFRRNFVRSRPLVAAAFAASFRRHPLEHPTGVQLGLFAAPSVVYLS
jgi:hypothetical protein